MTSFGYIFVTHLQKTPGAYENLRGIFALSVRSQTIAETRVSDPNSLHPDPAKNLNTAPDPSYFLTMPGLRN